MRTSCISSATSYSPEEVEEVFDGGYKVRRARQGLYIALGETIDGRLAFVVFRRLSKGVIRVVTARDMETNDRRRMSHMSKDLIKTKTSVRRGALYQRSAPTTPLPNICEGFSRRLETMPEASHQACKASSKTIRERHAAEVADLQPFRPDEIAAARKIRAISGGYQTNCDVDRRMEAVEVSESAYTGSVCQFEDASESLT